MSEHITKYLYKYLNSKFVFLMDLILGVIASIIAVLLSSFLQQGQVVSESVMLTTIILSCVSTIIGMLVFRTFAIVVRHASLVDVVNYVGAALLKEAMMLLGAVLLGKYVNVLIQFLVIDFFLTLFMIMTVRFLMLLCYKFINERSRDLISMERILIWGTTDKVAATVSRLQSSKKYRVVGLVSLDENESHLQILNVPIYTLRNQYELEKLVEDLTVRSILFTSVEELTQHTRFLEFAVQHGLKTLITPAIDETDGRFEMRNRIREVRIEDLLGRPEITISLEEIKENFGGKTVMVTGAAGSIGSELCRQLAGFGVRKLILFDNSETPMHNLRLEIEDKWPGLEFEPVIGSVRHVQRLDYAFRTFRPQIVFHAAAYKHVPLMEENPCEAILDNLCGSRHVADKCVEYGVEKMVMISTDKAVNPTNVMGASKRLAEIYVQSLGIALQRGEKQGVTKFVTTRFGNVLGSNGSVIPRFREQIEAGGPVTVTHPEITRFFMTIPEACRLVMEAATTSRGNEICVFDMGRSIKIADLATKMIQLAGLRPGVDIEIVYTGLRPGEKLYEEVLANEENTLPTYHERIRIAKVREYDYSEVLGYCEKLWQLATDVKIPDVVKLMKSILPEFKSNNSKFEIYD